jgi:PAS domain S-box-containing protein
MADPRRHGDADEENNYNHLGFLPQLENNMPEDLLDHPAVIAFQASRSSFLVTSPRLPGNPIVYASLGFLELTGYSLDRVLGRNCRFLQGPETDPLSVAVMSEAIDQGKDTAVSILNYRRDGSTFWNKVLISAIRDGKGNTTNYIGLQCPISSPTQLEVTSTQDFQL